MVTVQPFHVIKPDAPDMMQLASYSAVDWAKMVKGKVLLNLDKGILPEGTEMMVEPAIQQGLLVKDGEKFKGELLLGDGNLTLNGKQLPLNEVLSQFLPAAGMGAAPTLTPEAGNDMGIPEDIMKKIQQEGMTPEIMQLLEESDDVPPETLEMFKQLQQIQNDVQTGKLPEDDAKP